MHLLYVFPEPLPLPGKARAIQVVKTVAALSVAGTRVTLAYIQDKPGNGEHPFAAYGMDLPPNVILLPLSRRIPGLGIKAGALFVWRLQRWLATQGCEQKPDVMFVRHVKFAARWLRTGASLPFIYEAHEIFADTAPAHKRSQMARMEQAVLTKAALVLAITGQLGRLLQQRYNLSRNIPVLPSATDLPANLPEKDWSALPRSIVYAGSLYGWKGVDDLVAAAGYLPQDVEITIIGGDASAIVRLQKQQPLTGARIHYLGQQPHPVVMAHLATACLAVLPNRAGSVSAFTSPLKLFEYMASGCALVVSDLPVFREVLAEEDAAWFIAGDARSLAEAIRKSLNDPRGCQTAARQLNAKATAFGWAGRAQKLLSCCEALLENKPDGN